MTTALQVVLTLCVAYGFGWVLDRLKMPGGMMIGAVIGTCVLGVTTGMASMPGEAKTIAQIIAGAYIGAGVSRQELREMRTILRPALIILTGLLVINIVAGFLIHWMSPMDLITAFMSCTPGGLSDMPMIAADLGADTSKVVVLQFVRFMMGIALFPMLIRLICREDAKEETVLRPQEAKPDLPAAALTLLVAAVFGLLGMISPMPSGTMAFAVLGSIVFKALYPRAQVVRPLRKVAQCLAGAYVGAGIGLAQLREMPMLGVPILLLLATYLVGALGISWLLVRAGCFNRKEAMLAATPAGASDMALISADLGVRNMKLILLQVLRLIVVISFFPTILDAIASIFS